MFSQAAHAAALPTPMPSAEPISPLIPPQKAPQAPEDACWCRGTSSGRMAPMGAQNMQFAIWKKHCGSDTSRVSETESAHRESVSIARIPRQAAKNGG